MHHSHRFILYKSGMPTDFCENNWKSTCACRLTENEHKKRQKVQKEKDEIRENRENGKRETDRPRTDRAKNNEKTENNGKSASLISIYKSAQWCEHLFSSNVHIQFHCHTDDALSKIVTCKIKVLSVYHTEVTPK